MTESDPYLWLEDIEAPRSLDWVRAQNAESLGKLEADPSFASLQADILTILDSNARIPMVTKRGNFLYNFWRDKANPQGIWRRTTLAEYRKSEPQWELLLDIDALGKAEGVNWVWEGADCLRPDYNRCLIALSRGGADATITREFDIATRQFVADGFVRAEAKGDLSWIDRDTVYVSTDFGGGSMTDSGYPRLVKQWKRGTPLSAASFVYEVKQTDVATGAVHDDTPGFERDFVTRAISFYSSELYQRRAGGQLVRIDAPDSANKTVFREWLLLELRDPYTVGGKTYAAGALLAAPYERFMAGERKFDVLFEPTQSSSLAGFTPLLHHLIVNVLEDVRNRLYVMTYRDGAWSREPLKGAPAFGTFTVQAYDDEECDDYFLTSADYLTPTTLRLGAIDADPQPLKQLPAFFDAAGLEISQHFARSKDGTRVPYFMVARGKLALTGANPTLLYGYGGFEVSETPYYSAAVGRAWLTQGGVYVVANIRGGGEYGPRWHQAAVKQNRLRAYEDFAAVAEDLIARKVTAARHLGIQGGSNGGLLVGNMTVLYPQLFGAVVCQVPLLDMRRYHKLLAGASWMAEYGNPDDPREWAFIRTFSPYQNVRAGVSYPPVLFTTSTRDDRVHPGHARKMMAKMKAQGHDVLYYENIEGGHGGAANNAQLAKMSALAFTFLRQKLFARQSSDVETIRSR
jgi:prolyl oligopeptidase